MADRRRAILNGTAAAARMHRQLGISESSGGLRIDVFAAVVAMKVPLIFRPLDGLLGAYLNEPGPGIMVTTQRPLTVQRFTTAHELGHHVLGHRPSIDDDGILERNPFSATSRYDEQEIEADAFASAFLLPTWAVVGHMDQEQWTSEDLHSPEKVYQLSLRAGLSYRATCYILSQRRIIDPHTCQYLAEIEPRMLKQALARGYKPGTWHADVWDLSTRTGSTAEVELRTDDIVAIELPEHVSGGYLWDTSEFEASGFDVVVDEQKSSGRVDAVGAPTLRCLVAKPSRATGGMITLTEKRPWRPQDQPLASFSFQYRIANANATGLMLAQREERLRAA